MVLEIKRLLYEKRFTIEGARKFLETRGKTEAGPRGAAKAARSGARRCKGDLFADADSSGCSILIRKELREIAEMLK